MVPNSIEPSGRRSRRAWILGLLLILMLPLAARGDAFQAVWQALTGHDLNVAGPPVAASRAKLSEHNIEWVQEQPPQQQAICADIAQ